MKLNIFSMIATSLLVLGSCAEQEDVITPIQTGDEINFGSSTPEKVETRTIYGKPFDDEGNPLNYFPIYWEDNDEIAIFCPQANQPTTKLVNYRITPDTEDPSTSSAVTKIGDGAGLQWGEEKVHRFFGVYPASAVKNADPAKQEITMEIPRNQKVVDWATDAEGNIEGVPDTDLAYMYAFREVDRDTLPEGKSIPLEFHPLLTILEIEVNGPAVSSASESVTISNINIECTGEAGDIALAGKFTCSLDEQHGTIGQCHPVDDGTISNVISIPCFDDNGTPDYYTDDTFMTIGRGKKLKVKAFILPDETPIAKRALKIRVTVMGGAAKTKTLQTADIVPKKVNRVSLPALEANNESNNWMSSIPSGDTYITELSFPGSKFSVLTPDNCQNGQVIHQNASIQEQFNAGVRAFIIQTGCDASYRQNIAHDFQSGELYVAADNVRLGLKVADVLKDLTTVLNNAAEKEFVFVQLTLSAEASSTDLNDWSDDFIPVVYRNYFKAWLNTIEYQIKNVYMTDPNIALYTDEITNNTVINDVKHKIILRISYNNDSDKEYISSSDLPALFQWWNGAYQPDGIDMPWGSPNNVATMKSSYLEVTSVGDGGEISEADKEKYIKELFQKSVDMYLNNTEHNILFMVDLGGYYTAGKDPTKLALDMNALGVSELQKRGNNAGLGIVLMNFADRRDDSGKLYKSDWLLQTVVDNNFKFGLRTKGSSTTRTYDANYNNGGNAIGWDK